MPIYEQTYRRYQAREPLRRLRFWPITREVLRTLLAKRAFLGLLLVGWMPFVWYLIQIYIVSRYPQASQFFRIGPRMFVDFLHSQLRFAVLIAIFGGAGLVADDLRTGAILVYLSRPLTRRDYVLGKLGVLLALTFSATLVPGLILYGLGLALAPDILFKTDLAWVGPSVAAYALVISLGVSLLALAVSALSRTARVAGLGLAALFLVPEIAQRILRAISRRPEASLISLWADLRGVGNALFGTARAADPPWVYPVLVIAVVSLGSLFVLRRRVRAVEIVT
jgi:ABC-2 type transport system permease protein